ncbi:hypothetical protein OsJ_00119 [Oryza sativa Japonica Group]|uniref:Uncharacterized protein n=1 Tax=Oryza sativa subsp. japonica TaxID=39947 RepID=B9EYW5_ORYSJ|nr:hypothetical protein OsJ_00119 [Oryza sativa Japonica Group]
MATSAGAPVAAGGGRIALNRFSVLDLMACRCPLPDGDAPPATAPHLKPVTVRVVISSAQRWPSVFEIRLRLHGVGLFESMDNPQTHAVRSMIWWAICMPKISCSPAHYSSLSRPLPSMGRNGIEIKGIVGPEQERVGLVPTPHRSPHHGLRQSAAAAAAAAAPKMA